MGCSPVHSIRSLRDATGTESQLTLPILPAMEQPQDDHPVLIHDKGNRQFAFKAYHPQSGADVVTQCSAFGREIKSHAAGFNPGDEAFGNGGTSAL